ncbi:hypothetical protein NMQ14_02120 [Methyloversatilis sp. XJ19-13]|uniref:hypothetical protein n=1 Tax=Methyloversatilis sp. XJ19-13 TaxID=2963430 RepID=UPI00211B9218|nr:hypothetical protein [Methyloversatilis sp. XJ19-13]MCQ9373042.1 hypothetical protein [Methyloversatilis sp. XJ19-13]
MSRKAEFFPRTLLILCVLLSIIYLYEFVRNPTVSASCAALINFGALYLVLTGNRIATYVSAAAFGALSTVGVFACIDSPRNLALLFTALVYAASGIYFLSPSMQRFMQERDKRP